MKISNLGDELAILGSKVNAMKMVSVKKGRARNPLVPMVPEASLPP